MTASLICAAVFAALVLLYVRASRWVWTVSVLTALFVFSVLSTASTSSKLLLWSGALITLSVFVVPFIRRALLTQPIFKLYRTMVPAMSRTEQEALQAGTVGWDGELFSGAPDWQQLAAVPAAKLTEDEQAFLDGPVTELCRLIDDWEITHELADLPKPVWDFIKTQGFFGLIIPKEYGGQGFSDLMHSTVLMKLAAYSGVVASTVSVPNSLGPGELLLKYGTEQQKQYYLPRLAQGQEVPCFALTALHAGSDATAIEDFGVVCRGVHEGEEVIGVRLTWRKRYITLAPIATVLGLAFKLYDPDNLLGEDKAPGITCALIPTSHPGVVTGRRHFPLNLPFQNGPTEGSEVFIPADWIIGGPEMAGQGWRMLVECLSAGRAISLPSSGVGVTKAMMMTSGAYARVRKQFGISIGEFGGIEAPLARLVGRSYISDAARELTVSFIDQGEHPSVLSAVVKYHLTEMARNSAIDAMDIHGGKGICLGPKNYLGRHYQGAPIAITVEGANILTRNMIIFGQGAVRCHPYVLSEMQAASHADKKQGLALFDGVIFKHFAFSLSNILRAFVLGITQGRGSRAPDNALKRYYQHVNRFSAALALLADMSMYSLGGQLKRLERLSARLGDLLSYLYLLTAVLKRYEDQGAQKQDTVIATWCGDYLLFHIERCIDQLLKNKPHRLLSALLRVLVFPLGRRCYLPDDAADHALAQAAMTPGGSRARLIAGLYDMEAGNHPFNLLDTALLKSIAVEAIDKRVREGVKSGKVQWQAGQVVSREMILSLAVKAGVISAQECQQLREADQAVEAVLVVDDFDPSALAANGSS